MSKICPECGKIFSGRSDKRFCSDSCRSNHFRRTARDRMATTRLVTSTLMRNYSILGELVSDGIGSVPAKRMEYMGFDFALFTSCRRSGLLGITYFCFDIAYRVRGRKVEILTDKK